jgi:acylphosphatase
MSERSVQPIFRELFCIKGQVGAAGFPTWISRHLGRLGLEGRVLAQSCTSVRVIVAGPAELLDAMALACSLGPQDVWVDEIERLPGNDVSPDEFCSDSA